MTDIPHDPDLPFAVTSSSRGIIARFAYEADAKEYREELGLYYWIIVDTTPKPLIPVDAQYLTWKHGGNTTFAAKTEERNWTAIGLVPLANPISHTTVVLEDYFKRSGITPVVLDAREEES